MFIASCFSFLGTILGLIVISAIEGVILYFGRNSKLASIPFFMLLPVWFFTVLFHLWNFGVFTSIFSWFSNVNPAIWIGLALAAFILISAYASRKDKTISYTHWTGNDFRYGKITFSSKDDH